MVDREEIARARVAKSADEARRQRVHHLNYLARRAVQSLDGGRADDGLDEPDHPLVLARAGVVLEAKRKKARMPAWWWLRVVGRLPDLTEKELEEVLP